ncbi:NAC domain-containing protein 67-like [Panicum miliaceum]|uniref:NAC domain-containing protein 67-like n=1 Tax=Panicum miliaceum TaxID=4540 RepID=A0A3L6SGU8_PANMI|nr:NAC domain-containing protein 67-like [Panicum miliaceum]
MEASSSSSMASQLSLPPGFRFVPTDQEVIAYYLLRRIRGEPLPVGDILEDDPLSAPPWLLLGKHGRRRDAFFFAAGRAMNGRGSRQQRSCAGGGTWEGQGRRKGARGRDGERQRVRVGGEEIEWRKYALNFHEEGVKGSTGWVMHEYSITAPPSLAASPQRVYRIRLSGHGRNAQKRKRGELDWGSDDEEEEEYHYHGAARAATLPVPVVAEAVYAPFAGECQPAPPQPEPVDSLPVATVVDAGNGDPAGWTEAGAPADGASSAASTSPDQDLPALVDDGWDFMCSLSDLVPDFDFFPGAAAAGEIPSPTPMVPAA